MSINGMDCSKIDQELLAYAGEIQNAPMVEDMKLQIAVSCVNENDNLDRDAVNYEGKIASNDFDFGIKGPEVS